jgi:hypothetical protein
MEAVAIVSLDAAGWPRYETRWITLRGLNLAEWRSNSIPGVMTRQERAPLIVARVI